VQHISGYQRRADRGQLRARLPGNPLPHVGHRGGETGTPNSSLMAWQVRPRPYCTGAATPVGAVPAGDHAA
jgi:hypothetical protein